MAVYTWPYPPSSSSDPGSSGLPVNSTPSQLQGLLDLAFDPLTRDCVDAPDGSLVETTDSRSAVLFQMQADLNAWWADPTQGSRIRAMLSAETDGEPVTVEALADEVKRCLQLLVDEGVIVDLKVGIDVDEAGRPVILMLYRDLSTGTPVDIAYIPFNA